MSGPLCQSCGLRPASILYVETIQVNQQIRKRQLRLCETCAKQKGLAPEPSGIHVPDLLKAFLETAGPIALPAPGPMCLSCGITWQQVQQTGFLGCPKCYTTFSALLRPVLRRIQRGPKHTGRTPSTKAEAAEPVRRTAKRASPLARLKKELEEAVRREEYEKAAEIRDRIRRLQAAEGKG